MTARDDILTGTGTGDGCSSQLLINGSCWEKSCLINGLQKKGSTIRALPQAD